MPTDTEPKPLPTEPYTVIEVTWQETESTELLVETYVLMPNRGWPEGWLCLDDMAYWDLDGEDITWRPVALPVTPSEEASHGAAHQ